MSWQHTGHARPQFAVTPLADQESVWDYPRPPCAVPDRRLVVVRCGEIEVARTRRSVRVLETASPPTFYLPPEDVRVDVLQRAPGTTHCEWKGEAQYWTLVAAGRRVDRVAWSYRSPAPPYEAIRDCFSFYPGRVECYVDGERVVPQPGHFYGGWITSDIVGPFKGEPGSEHW